MTFVIGWVEEWVDFDGSVEDGAIALSSTLPPSKLNFFYAPVVQLRFKALSYLADECGEEISAYC